MVALSTSRLPKRTKRYLMGVGYVEEREMPPTPIPACGEWIPPGAPAPGCRGLRKDTALPRRDSSLCWGEGAHQPGGGSLGV